MSNLTILPAIDMKGGRCVRLRQGRAEDETVYADDPLLMARRWRDEGAGYLHLVDLDGAFQGQPVHDEIVLRIACELDIPVEIGGGLRTADQIARYLEGGVDRVILGTKAIENPDAMLELVQRFGRGLAVGIDARDGFVQVRGWTETTKLRALDLARDLDGIGVQCIIYTDTARDGMLDGVNTGAMAEMCDEVGCDVIASGGVASGADVRALAELARANLTGVIIGKALYENTVTLKELLWN